MKNFHLEALVALVNSETAVLNADVARYGKEMWDHRTPAYLELSKRFENCTDYPKAS